MKYGDKKCIQKWWGNVLKNCNFQIQELNRDLRSYTDRVLVGKLIFSKVMGLVKYEFYNIYRDICLVIRILIILFY